MKAKLILSLMILFSMRFAEAQTAYNDAVSLRQYIAFQYLYKTTKMVVDVHGNAVGTPVTSTALGKEHAVAGSFSKADSTVVTNTPDGGKQTVLYQFQSEKTAFSTNGQNSVDVLIILKRYITDQNLNGAAVGTAYNSNPFIKPYLPVGYGTAPTDVPSTIFSSVGSFNAATILDGVSQFLIERGKAEVNEAFFIKLKKFLDNYPEFSTLFPNTYTFLSNYNSWEYANLLNTLKSAFNKDINQLPADIIKLKDIPEPVCTCLTNKALTTCNNTATRIKKIKAFFATNNGVLLLSACQVANGILQNQKIPEVIKSVTTEQFLLSFKVYQTPLATPPVLDADATANVVNALKLINFVSLSIESNETGKNYITADQFAGLKNDLVLRTIFLGLIYQQIKDANITFKIGATTIDVGLLLTSGHVEGMISYITNIYNQAKNLQTAVDQLKADKLAAKADLAPDYAAITENTRQLLAATHNISIIDARLVVPSEIDKFYTYTNQSLQVTNDIFSKNYNAAVMGSLNMISDLVKSEKNKEPDIADFCTNFLKYSSFAANVVEAKNAADVKSAIEAIALPVGSYTVKQKSDFNISVNAFVGYAWDFEKFFPDQLYANGIYAPIGFSFSWGTARSGGVPVGFFVSVIDVGSFVSYNLQKTSTDVLKQEVRLESVFSPSLQFYLQYPHTPLTMAFGWRQTPKLFYTKSDDTFIPIKSQSVFNISLLIDIPLFTLHNSPFTTTKR